MGKNLIFVGLLCLIPSTMSEEYTFLSTPLGGLRGLKEKFGSQEILKFLNIPFAKAPIGNLRFMDPVPFGSWEGTRAAYKYGHICPQAILPAFQSRFWTELYKKIPSSSEDCLILNVYVPNSIEGNKKAVMVFIHGGGFTLGDGASYDPTELALTGDVIVVTIQYRVGVLGFFSTGDSSSPGNYGLKDQQLAFKWVHDYISAFGGDENMVTIFGESAGSVSVAHQTMIPENSGLFQRAIMESGANGGFLGICENLRNTSAMYGIQIGCLDETITEETLNTKELMQCLRGLFADAILDIQLSLSAMLMTRSMTDCFTGPVIDGRLLKRHPKEILEDTGSSEMAFFKSVDIIVGTTNFEGAMFSAMIQHMEGPMNFTALDGLPDNVLEAIGKPFAKFLFSEEIAGDIIIDNLKAENKIEQGLNFLKFVSDAVFTVPTMMTLLSHADQNNQGHTYQYLFSLEYDHDLVVERLPWVRGHGADHGSELICLFGPGGFVEIFKDEIQLENLKDCRNNIMLYWANFARTGNPNGNGVLPWPLFTTSEQQYLNIAHTAKVEDHLFEDRMKFLMETVPSMIQQQTKDEL